MLVHNLYILNEITIVVKKCFGQAPQPQKAMLIETPEAICSTLLIKVRGFCGIIIDYILVFFQHCYLFNCFTALQGLYCWFKERNL